MVVVPFGGPVAVCVGIGRKVEPEAPALGGASGLYHLSAHF